MAGAMAGLDREHLSGDSALAIALSGSVHGKRGAEIISATCAPGWKSRQKQKSPHEAGLFEKRSRKSEGGAAIAESY